MAAVEWLITIAAITWNRTRFAGAIRGTSSMLTEKNEVYVIGMAAVSALGAAAAACGAAVCGRVRFEATRRQGKHRGQL